MYFQKISLPTLLPKRVLKIPRGGSQKLKSIKVIMNQNPIGEEQERQTLAHLEVHKSGRIGGETAYIAGSEMHCSK